MNYLDAALLNLTEWLCHKFQLWTGRTNVWLALQFTNLSIVVYFVWAIAFFWDSRLSLRIALGMFFGGLLYVLTQTVFKVPVEAYEQSAWRRVAKGFRNPRRIRDAMLRISFLTLSLVMAWPMFLFYRLGFYIALPTYFLILLMTIVLYLMACDPMPPAPAKMRDWIRSLARAFRPATPA
jgi:hypothetical protein